MSTISASNPNNRRILCVGMCVLDIIHVCESYPVEDSDRRCLKGYWQRGGNASNNCTVIRNFGMECEFLGMLSNSEAFGFLLNDMQQRKIHYESCPTTAQDPPFSSVILVEKNDSRTIIHSNLNFPILRYEHFRRLNLNKYAWIHFEARNVAETMKMLKHIESYNLTSEKRIQTSLDLEKMQLENLPMAELVDYVFLGKDLAIYLGYKECREACYGLRDRQQMGGCKGRRKPAIICTWGEKGSGCLDENDQFHFVEPSTPEKIIDSLGAGDTYLAAVIYGLCQLKLRLPQAIALGNRCAGYKLSHQGYDAIHEFCKTDIAFQ